jgi:chaperonin cofactor prefoldin
MGKITKKYIGEDQVGSVQVELENSSALRAKAADGLSSIDLMELDPSNLLQLKLNPYLPGDATAALQSVPKQQLDAAVGTLAGDISALDGRVDVLEPKVSTLESEMDAAQADIISLDGRVDVLEPKVSTLESEMDAAQADIISLDGRLDVLEPKVSTLESEMDAVQSDISDLQAEDLTFVKLDGSRAMTGDLSMMPSIGVHHKITGLADPVDARDAANKQYVDAVAEGLHVHAPAKVIINQTLESASGGTVSYDNGADGVGATLTLSVALTAYDGYTFIAGDRVIVNGQVNKAHNGIYTVGSNGSLGTVFTRALDYNTPAEMAGGDFVFVQDGTQYADTGWVEIDVVAVVGTDPVQFVQFSGAGTYTAGDGLSLDGTEFNVRYDNTTISLDGSNQLRVDPAVMGRIGTLESEMDTAQADIIALEGRMDTAESDINALEGRMDTAESDITALEAEDLTFLKLDGTRPMTGVLDMSGQRITGVGEASELSDAIPLGQAITAFEGKANTNLDNLETTAIPAGVSIVSLKSGPIGTGAFAFATAPQSAAVSGSVVVSSGAGTGSFASGLAILTSGQNSGTGATGNAVVTSGAITNAASFAATGLVNIQTGNNAGSGASGDIFISTGSVVSGVRGKIAITSRIVEINSQLDMQSNKIIDLADPVAAQDAATKAYVDAQISAGTDFHKQAITLSAGDITNQYVDLSVVALAQSCQIGVSQRVWLWEGLDYSVDLTGGAGGMTRITFIPGGPSASAGAEALEAGQTLYIQCVID